MLKTRAYERQPPAQVGKPRVFVSVALRGEGTSSHTAETSIFSAWTQEYRERERRCRLMRQAWGSIEMKERDFVASPDSAAQALPDAPRLLKRTAMTCYLTTQEPFPRQIISNKFNTCD